MMQLEWIQHWSYWHWWLTGLAFILFDLLLGANFALVWTGGAFLLTGVLLFLIPILTIEWQLVLFAIFEGAALWLWRLRIVRQMQATSDRPSLNNRLQTYVGQVHILTRDVVDGKSAIRVHDSDWLVNCNEPLLQGTRVRIVRVEGVTLVVEKFN